ncbi:SGNH/GDSL hydrolase family protein [Aeoliella mucimassa]|uniref:GDSL-like Lipase/Acylhydrolase n=1 Tax=Aeoliella mucimassa TaxID=2527972 RepID=A0A518AV04_9BACT|nr:SGNH/GDSL hydrolase family protein [Aeoliella mucimassa]QDU58554.1 GDSL-like Lipase/Acylhydrolase [Aeoliella mucimassa]
MTSSLDRRHFLSTGIASAAAAGMLASGSAKAADSPASAESIITPGSTILFQGDSITDAGRKRGIPEANDQAALGGGYAFLAAAELLVDHPKAELKIYNRGISGNKVNQLAARWQEDCFDLKPDVLSILIGVNDIWHHLNDDLEKMLEVYGNDYQELLTRTKAELPETKLVLCEPFVLRCGAVNDKWFPAFDNFRAAAKQMAEEFDTIWVPYQTMFDEAVKLAPPAHWAGDGVHPSAAGAALMAHGWMTAVSA